MRTLNPINTTHTFKSDAKKNNDLLTKATVLRWLCTVNKTLCSSCLSHRYLKFQWAINCYLSGGESVYPTLADTQLIVLNVNTVDQRTFSKDAVCWG